MLGALCVLGAHVHGMYEGCLVRLVKTGRICQVQKLLSSNKLDVLELGQTNHQTLSKGEVKTMPMHPMSSVAERLSFEVVDSLLKAAQCFWKDSDTKAEPEKELSIPAISALKSADTAATPVAKPLANQPIEEESSGVAVPVELNLPEEDAGEILSESKVHVAEAESKMKTSLNLHLNLHQKIKTWINPNLSNSYIRGSCQSLSPSRS